MSLKTDDLDEILYGELEFTKKEQQDNNLLESDNSVNQDVSIQDLENDNESKVEELRSELENAYQEIAKLKEENAILQEENNIFAKNISALYRTATSEIRKLESQKNTKKSGHHKRSNNQRKQRD